jgi:hypothetical protein
MQIRLSDEEAWSAMTLIVSQVLDGVELSAKGTDAVKKWRSSRDKRSKLMKELAGAINAVMPGAEASS